MAHTYVVSSQKSTAVHHAVACNFVSPDETNLVVVKSNNIEVLSLVSDSLILKIKTSLYGKITSLHAYRPRTSNTDVLFVLTERKHFCVLGFDPVLEVLITLARGNLKDRVGHDVESGQRALMDPENRMIGMVLYDGLLKVLPLGPNGNFQEAFNIPLEETRLIDIAFLHRQSKPTFCLLYEDNKMGRHLKTYTVDTREKISTEGLWKQSHVEFSARMLIPVQDSAGGVLVVGQSTITYFSGGGESKSESYSIGMDHKFITSFCSMDSSGERFLLGDKHGTLSVLILLRHASRDMVTGLVLEDLGEASISERLCYLQEGLLFVGSCFGDSQLVKLLSAEKCEIACSGEDGESHKEDVKAEQEHLEVLETYTNIGPILDMCVVPSERMRQSQVVTCSGAYKDGSLRVIKSGIGIREQACIEMEGIKGIWSLQHPVTEFCGGISGSDSEIFDKYLVQAYTWETRVLWIDEEDEMCECEIPGFSTQVTTLYCGNMEWRTATAGGVGGGVESYFVQVTPEGARLVCAKSGELVHEVPCEKKVVVAEGNCSQVVLALSGGELLYLELAVTGADLSRSPRLVQVGSVQLDQDVACMSIRPEVCLERAGGAVVDLMDVDGDADVPSAVLHPRGKSSLLVLGLWTDNSVRMYALPTLQEVSRVSLGVAVQVRAVLLASLSSKAASESGTGARNLHLLIGLGDGRVFTYLLTMEGDSDTPKKSLEIGVVGLPTLSDRQELQLGSRPISFSLFMHDKALCVFASCDRPTVIFSRSRHNAKLLFSPVNITDDVTKMAPFHSQCFPNCLAMSSETGLLIGTIDSLQTIHIQSYPLHESPRHICFHQESATYVVCSTKTEMTSRGESVQDRILFLDNKEFVTRCVFELDPNETAMSCHSIQLDPHTAGAGAGAGADGSVEYIIIGTAYVLPEEQQPSRGRMLMFEVTSPPYPSGEEGEGDSITRRHATLICESVTNGAVFCLAAIQGKLVAGIDSKVQIYRFAPKGADGAGVPELVVLCEHVGHIMSLFCKTSGDLILIGDIVRSISVLQLKQITSGSGTELNTLKEVSRDFNSNYMRAVEILSEEYFMGSEDNGNLFVVKRPGEGDNASGSNGVTLSEEEKSRLEMQSAFHLGDYINVFQRGMMGSNNVGDVDSTAVSNCGGGKSEGVGGECHSFGSSVSPEVLFGTVAGCLGAVFTLSPETFHFVHVLEQAMTQVVGGVGGLNHEDYRQFAHERRQGHTRRTIDGDLIEMFLDLPEAIMRQVTKQVNDELHHLALVSAQEASKARKKCSSAALPDGADGAGDLVDKEAAGIPSVSLEEIIHRLEELVRLH